MFMTDTLVTPEGAGNRLRRASVCSVRPHLKVSKVLLQDG